MSLGVIGVSLLILSIAAVGFLMEESLKIRDCRVEVLNIKSGVLELRVRNPTIFPLSIERVEISGDGVFYSFASKLSIRPASQLNFSVPLKLQGGQTPTELKGVVHVSGILGDVELPFST